MKHLEIITAERMAKRDVTVTQTTAHVETPTLIEQLHKKGVLGSGKQGQERQVAGLWLTELYGRIYASEGVSGYSVLSSSEYEMSDAEAELRALYHRYLRELPAATTQLLRFVCHDQALPRVITGSIADSLDKLIAWRELDRRKQRDREDG